MQQGNREEQAAAGSGGLREPAAPAHAGGGLAAATAYQRATGARERVALARQRELAAHARAIGLHEQAAVLQERLGHPDRAARARVHAAHAQELLERAQAEQLRYEQLRDEQPA